MLTNKVSTKAMLTCVLSSFCLCEPAFLPHTFLEPRPIRLKSQRDGQSVADNEMVLLLLNLWLWVQNNKIYVLIPIPSHLLTAQYTTE